MTEFSEQPDIKEVKNSASKTSTAREILSKYGLNIDIDEKIPEREDKVKKLFGEDETEVLTVQDAEGNKLILANVVYADNLSAIVMIDTDELDDPKEGKHMIEVKDIVYSNHDGTKAFSYRSILGGETQIVVNNKTTFEAFGGSRIEIPPLGTNRPPLEPISRGMWNVYKKIEPLVLFHEAQHVEQRRNNRRGTMNGVEAEREAWAYSLKLYRQLRDEGLDVLPDINNNNQAISRLELGLITYDFGDSSNYSQGDVYSRRTEQSFVKGLPKSVNHIPGFFGAVLNTATKDPSLVKDTLSYKGKRNTENPPKLKEILSL